MINSGCATLLTADPERLAGFYESLGMERRLAAGDWIELRAPDGFRLALRRAEALEPLSHRAAVGFGSDGSVEEVTARLEALGAQPRLEKDVGAGVLLLWFEDPDANPVYFWWVSEAS